MRHDLSRHLKRAIKRALEYFSSDICASGKDNERDVVFVWPAISLGQVRQEAAMLGAEGLP